MIDETLAAGGTVSPPQQEALNRSAAELAGVELNEAIDRANRLAVDLGIANERIQDLERQLQKAAGENSNYVVT